MGTTLLSNRGNDFGTQKAKTPAEAKIGTSNSGTGSSGLGTHMYSGLSEGSSTGSSEGSSKGSTDWGITGKQALAQGAGHMAMGFAQHGFNRRGVGQGISGAGSAIGGAMMSSGNPYAMAAGAALTIGSQLIGGLIANSKNKKQSRGSAIGQLMRTVAAKRDVGEFSKEKDLRKSMSKKGSAQNTINAIQLAFADKNLSFNEAVNLAKFLAMDKKDRKKHPLRVYWNQRLFGREVDDMLYAAEGASDSAKKAAERYTAGGGASGNWAEQAVKFGDGPFGHGISSSELKFGTEAEKDQRDWETIQMAYGDTVALNKDDFFGEDGKLNRDSLAEKVGGWANYNDAIATASNIGEASDGGSSGTNGTNGTLQLPPEFMPVMQQLQSAVQRLGQQTSTIVIQIGDEQIRRVISANGSTRN